MTTFARTITEVSAGYALSPSPKSDADIARECLEAFKPLADIANRILAGPVLPAVSTASDAGLAARMARGTCRAAAEMLRTTAEKGTEAQIRDMARVYADLLDGAAVRLGVTVEYLREDR